MSLYLLVLVADFLESQGIKFIRGAFLPGGAELTVKCWGRYRHYQLAREIPLYEGMAFLTPISAPSHEVRLFQRSIWNARCYSLLEPTNTYRVDFRVRLVLMDEVVDQDYCSSIPLACPERYPCSTIAERTDEAERTVCAAHRRQRTACDSPKRNACHRSPVLHESACSRRRAIPTPHG